MSFCPPRAERLLAVGRVLAVLTSAFLAWAAVADNPAVCPDDVESAAETQHGTPAGPHCCLTAPCHTPVVVRETLTAQQPAAKTIEKVTPAPSVLYGIDTPAPPTPPPTAFD